MDRSGCPIYNREERCLMGGKTMSVSIQEIPQFVFDELLALISEKTRDVLLKYVLTDCLDQKLFLDTYIRNIFDTVFVEEVDILEIRSKYSNKRQITKKNWFKQLQKDPTPIHKEREMLQLVSKTTSIKEVIPDIDNPEQYIQNKLTEIEKWAYDKGQQLIDFIYLNSKQKYQIERAVENDIILMIWDFFDKNPKKNWISFRSEDMVENPIFTDGKKKMPNVHYNSGVATAYDDYKLSDNRFLRLLISADDDDEVQLEKVFMLDDVDSEIFDLVMLQRDDEQFYNAGVIKFDLSPILHRIYGNTSKRSYDALKTRLKRFRQFSLEGRSIGKETITDFGYNLFEAVNVIQDKVTGRIHGEMIFTKSFHQTLITKQTVRIYSHLIHRLENRLSKILIYAFQKERLDAHLHGRSVKRHFDYTFFMNRIRFRSRKVESILKQVNESLQDFKNANILIEDFNRAGNGFEIILTPLSEAEITDFFAGSAKSIAN